MGDEVEMDFQNFVAGGNGRGAQSSRGDIERHLPAVIEPGRERQPDLTDDLRPELQRGRRVPPRGIRQFRPGSVTHQALL